MFHLRQIPFRLKIGIRYWKIMALFFSLPQIWKEIPMAHIGPLPLLALLG